MNIRGFSSNLYGWQQEYVLAGKEIDTPRIFEQCAEAGLDAVEVDLTPEILELLKVNKLKVSASYIRLDLHKPFDELDVDKNVKPAANRLAEAGGSDLLVNATPKGGWKQTEEKTEEEVKRQGENLTRVAEMVSSLGLRVCMHNHAAQYRNSINDLRSVVDFAGSQVGLCVDTGWAHVSGCDPIEWIRMYPERVFALHLRNQYGLVPAEDLLEGDISIPILMQTLKDIGYGGWLAQELWHPTETKPIRSIAEDVSRSITYLKSLL